MAANDIDFKNAGDIGEFLSLWLRNPLLAPPHQEVFDRYYWSYRRHFGPRMKRAYAEQIKEVNEIVQSRPNARVLEIGFGLGTESLWLSTQGAQVVAIDILKEFKEAAEHRKAILERSIGRDLNCIFRCVPLLLLDEEAAFDVIWLEQTFHHLEPRNESTEKIVSLMKPGGHVVVSEVNALNPFIQLQLFIARGTSMYFTHIDEEGRRILVGRERITTADRLGRAFERLDVERRKVRYFRVFPNHRFFERFGQLESWLSHRQLAPLKTHFNYVGRRRG